MNWRMILVGVVIFLCFVALGVSGVCTAVAWKAKERFSAVLFAGIMIVLAGVLMELLRLVAETGGI